MKMIVLEPPHQRIAIRHDEVVALRAYPEEQTVSLMLKSGHAIAIEDEDPNELFEQLLKEMWT